MCRLDFIWMQGLWICSCQFSCRQINFHCELCIFVLLQIETNKVMTDRNLLFLNMTMNDKNETVDVCLVEKQQIPVYSFWSDTIRTGTNNLPHLRRAR